MKKHVAVVGGSSGSIVGRPGLAGIAAIVLLRNEVTYLRLFMLASLLARYVPARILARHLQLITRAFLFRRL